MATNRPGSWVPDTATTKWISPTANQDVTVGNPAGIYNYTTTLTIPAGGGLAHLAGELTGDNRLIDVQLNGTSLGGTLGDYSSVSNFSGSLTLPGGAVTLTFVVRNDADAQTINPTGLFASGLTMDFSPTVAVNTTTVTGTYGGTISQSGTFADLDAGDVVTLTSSQGTVTKSTTVPGTFNWTESNATLSGPVRITATDLQGNVTTTTFDITLNPPSITGVTPAPTAVSGGSAVVVNPNIVITAPGLANLTSASVSIGTNFTPGEDQLLFTDQNGITGSYNATTGVLTLTGAATPAQYQTALRSVTYQDTNTNPVTANRAARGMNFVLGPATYNATTGHFYEFIPAEGISWTDAEAAAGASSLFGSTGYLATITSAAENQPFVTGKVSGWIGADDAAAPGTWVDSDGPEAGTQFWQGFATGTAVNGQYNNWATGEPQSTAGANYVELVNGQWVNLANGANVPGYVVEYNAPSSDPAQSLVATSSVNVSSVSDTPVVVQPGAATLTNIPTYNVTGTADAGSLVQIYVDANGDGKIDDGESVAYSEQLAPGQTSYSIPVTLVPNGLSNFLVTATVSGATESAPAVVPPITEDSLAPVPVVITSPTQSETVTTTTATITGTAEAGTLVQIYRNDGSGKPTGASLGSVQLGPDQTTFSFTLTLTTGVANNFVVTSTDAAGNVSTPAIVPTITQSTPATTTTITGVVYLDLNANGAQGTNEPGFPARVLFLSLDGSGIYQAGDPTTTTDAKGAFTFTGVPIGSSVVIDFVDKDTVDRYSISLTSSTSGGPITIGVVPFSPIFPVPVVTRSNLAGSTQTSTDRYVQSLYHAVLGRSPSLGELSIWDSALASQPLSNGQIAQLFVNSPEHRLNQVIGYYRDFLGRSLDPVAQNWINELTSGVSEQTVVAGILNSPEYQQASYHADPATYVRDLYLEVLGRQGADSEVAAWVSTLASGRTRTAVVLDFVTSAEAANQLVTSFYVNDLRRQPEGGNGPIYWANALEHSGSSASVVAVGILASAEFQTDSNLSGTIVSDPIPVTTK